jgi:hypothetical protein
MDAKDSIKRANGYEHMQACPPCTGGGFVGDFHRITEVWRCQFDVAYRLLCVANTNPVRRMVRMDLHDECTFTRFRRYVRFADVLLVRMRCLLTILPW